MTDHTVILIIALPLTAAFIMPVLGRAGTWVRNITALAVIVAVNVMLFSLVPEVMIRESVITYVVGAGEPALALVRGLDFPVRIVLKVDAFSLFMGILSGIITMAAFFFSWIFIREEEKKNYYVILVLLMMTGMIGLEFTNDLFNFFVFLEILSIASSALVAYRAERRHPAYAGYKYLLVSASATGFLLLGIGFCYAQYGSFNIDYIHRVMGHTLLDRMALLFMVIPLAMKAGAIPMHMWVPDTYSEAPAPVTAMLVSASQASLYGVFRLTFSLYGSPHGGVSINYVTLGWIIIIMGVLSMFVGVTMALVQRDVKRLMAYHAVSQTGYMLLGVGVGVAVYRAGDNGASFRAFGALAMTGGIFHIMNHAFYKGLLFMTSGVMERRFGTRNLNSMAGLGHRDVFTAGAFIVGSLAIAGIPPFNGFASKLIIYESVFMFSPVLSVIAIFVSILTLASFMKVFYAAFMGPRRDDLIVDREGPSPGMKAAMGILCVLIIIIGLLPGRVIDLLVNPAVRSLAGTLAGGG